MRTLFITGGCGFIGSHFVRAALGLGTFDAVNLDKLTYAGDTARLTDVGGHPSYRFVHGDVVDRALLDRLFEEKKPWAVVNFAAESHVDRSILDPAPFLRANLIGTQILLDAARRHEAQRFVQISTDEVYGDAAGKESFREDGPLTPSSPYAASKASADLLALAYGRTYGLPVLIVRSSNNYGPFQFPEKLVPLTIRNAMVGAELPLYGDGLQRRDWLHVEDNCRAILAILERGRPGSIYNVGAGEARTNLATVRALCGILAEEAGLELKALHERVRFVADRPGHDRRYAVNTEKIRRELAWRPRIFLSEGLRRTVRWYLNHRDWLNRIDSPEYRSYCEAVYVRNWERPGRQCESQ
ncbi:MAG TPA: dTDP-glucose 4,6-dehydratase [Candidatus Binatia bacterium]